jgi:hypothetical protein
MMNSGRLSATPGTVRLSMKARNSAPLPLEADSARRRSRRHHADHDGDDRGGERDHQRVDEVLRHRQALLHGAETEDAGRSC